MTGSDERLKRTDGLRPDSVETMFRLHYTRLVQSLALVAGDQEVAADAVQEAFIQAYKRWSRISRYDDPVAWVRRVAINRLYNHHRRMRIQRAYLLRFPQRELIEDPEPADVEVVTAVRSLPLKQPTAVILHYFADLSVAEVADALGTSEGTIKTHLFRARENLRPLLEASS